MTMRPTEVCKRIRSATRRWGWIGPRLIYPAIPVMPPLDPLPLLTPERGPHRAMRHLMRPNCKGGLR